jgi:hypothetical protein
VHRVKKTHIDVTRALALPTPGVDITLSHHSVSSVPAEAATPDTGAARTRMRNAYFVPASSAGITYLVKVR